MLQVPESQTYTKNLHRSMVVLAVPKDTWLLGVKDMPKKEIQLVVALCEKHKKLGRQNTALVNFRKQCCAVGSCGEEAVYCGFVKVK